MNEFKRYQNYRYKQRISPAAAIEQRYGDIKMIDKYILQREKLRERIKNEEQIIVDKKDFVSFVEQAAAAIEKALK